MGDPTTDKADAADTLELEVSDFGPIVNARVALRPLTVLVGPSNTGKSYLATLIYALHRFLSVRQFPFRVNRDGSLTIGSRSAPGMSEKAVNATFEFMRSVEKASALPCGGRVSLSPEVSDVLRSGFAERADLLADEIKRCFGIGDPGTLVRRERKTAADIAIRRRVTTDPGPLEHALTIGGRPGLTVGLVVGSSISVEHQPDTLVGVLDMLRSMPEEAKGLGQGLAWAFLAATALPHGFGALALPAYYLPADRTGLMYTYNAVVGGLIASASTAGPRTAAQTPVLSGVVADFLEQLLGIDRFGRELDLGTNIEQAILGGSVGIEWSPNTNYPHFVYRPEGWREDLALTNASSMVSDVAPVVLYLRHLVSPQNVLIVEEPESHMHPAMQVKFMNQLAALVKTGVRVIVTTHSEWMTEELGNIVRRSGLSEEERKGTALDKEQVGVWLFEAKKRPKGSVVREVLFDEYGYSGTGFDEVASALHNEWANTTSRIENGP